MWADEFGPLVKRQEKRVPVVERGSVDLRQSRGGTARPANTLLGLQRTAGNAAVSTLFPPRADLATRPSAFVLQRQPMPATAQRPTPAAGAALDARDRKVIEDETRAEIVLAFTAFTDACQANITAMRAAAKADAEMAAAVIDIATGFLAPAFAGFVVKKLAKKADALTEVTKTQVQKVLSQNDVFKGIFTGATKVANSAMKIESTTLFGEDDRDALLDRLKQVFQKNAATLAGRVASMPDNELVAVWGAYDADVANVSSYKAVIRDLLAQYAVIRDLGTHKIFSDDTGDREVRMAKLDRGPNYVIIEREGSTFMGDPGPWHLRLTVPAHLESIALRIAAAKGAYLGVMPLSEIKTTGRAFF
jgi:hypothetical protein